MIFSSPHYYLTVFVCVMFSYLIDLLVEAWRFEISTNPTDFLRKIIKYDKDVTNGERMKQFEAIF
jgi:hypothetical protein